MTGAPSLAYERCMHQMACCTLLLFTVTGCTLHAVTPDPTETEFKPAGEVMARLSGASFDSTRVRSPMANISRRADGSWGGMLGGQAIDVSVSGPRVRGVDFSLNLDTSQPKATIITGQFQGKIYRFELTPEKALVRTPSVSSTYPGRVQEEGLTKFGPAGELELRGEATAEPPPWPQLGFTLMAAFQ